MALSNVPESRPNGDSSPAAASLKMGVKYRCGCFSAGPVPLGLPCHGRKCALPAFCMNDAMFVDLARKGYYGLEYRRGLPKKFSSVTMVAGHTFFWHWYPMLIRESKMLGVGQVLIYAHDFKKLKKPIRFYLRLGPPHIVFLP